MGKVKDFFLDNSPIEDFEAPIFGLVEENTDIIVDEFGNCWYNDIRLPRASDLISGNLSDKKSQSDSDALKKGNNAHSFVFQNENLDKSFFSENEIINLLYLKERIENLKKERYKIVCSDAEAERAFCIHKNFMFTYLRDFKAVNEEKKHIIYYDLKTGEFYDKYNLQSTLYTMEDFEKGYKVEFYFFMSKTGTFKQGSVFFGNYLEIQKMYDNLFPKIIENLDPVEKYLILKEKLEEAKKEMNEFLDLQNSKKIENEYFTAIFKDGYSFVEKPKEGGKIINVSGSWQVKRK